MVGVAVGAWGVSRVGVLVGREVGESVGVYGTVGWEVENARKGTSMDGNWIPFSPMQEVINAVKKNNEKSL
jgi:hypothetical protein